MIVCTVIASILIPASIQQNNVGSTFNKTYVVQAVIDSARIIGLPPSKAARIYAKKIQMPDQSTGQIIDSIKPLSSRRLFFQNYFQ